MVLRAILAGLLALVLAACATTQPPQPSASDTAGKRIALTFDDVPRGSGAFLTAGERSERLIAGLRRARVQQAAFFVNPGKLEERPEGGAHIAAYVAAGHVIANHSNTHPHLDATDAETYLADIDAAAEWLRGREGYRPWFRFPFLDEGKRDKDKRDTVRTGLDERGLSNGYVTVDASDWWLEQAANDARAEGHTMDMAAFRKLYVASHVEAANFYEKLARDTLGRSPAHVLLLHETDLAALWIVDLVAGLRAEGWTIVTADEAYRDPIARLRPDVPSAQGTLTEALAWERGMPAPRWYERNDTRIYARLFRERVLKLPPEEDHK